MPQRTILGFTLISWALTAVGAAVKLGGFINVPWAWALIIFAAAFAFIGTGMLVWPYRRRLSLRWPVRLLPAHFMNEHIYTADKLEAEFIRVEDAYSQLALCFRLLKQVYDYNDKVERKESTAALFRLGPQSFRVTREREEQYAIAKQQFWNALREFSLIYKFLT